jgi:hypothetical protein
MTVSLASAIIGGDLALFRATNFGVPISLDEKRLSKFLNKNLYTNNSTGIVTGYGFIP